MNKKIILLCVLSQSVSLFSAEPLIFTETSPTDRLDEEELFYRSQIRQKARKIQFERRFEDEGQLEEFKARLAKVLKNFDTFKTDKAVGRYLFSVKSKDHLVALVVVTLFPEQPALVVPLAMVSEVNKTELWMVAEREAKKRGSLAAQPFYTNSGTARGASTSSEELALREVDEKEPGAEEQVTTTKIVLARHMSARSVQVPVSRVRTSSEGSESKRIPPCPLRARLVQAPPLTRRTSGSSNCSLGSARRLSISSSESS